MEARRVECDGITRLRGLVKDLACSIDIIPDSNGFVLRTRHNQLLSNADIQASDLFVMEATVHLFDFDYWISFVEHRNFGLQKLLVLSDIVDLLTRD